MRRILDWIRGLWVPTVLLWLASACQKTATLGLSFRLGRLDGTEGLGVMAAVGVTAWIVHTLMGLGLPDRALFQSAQAHGLDQRPEPGFAVLHGRFLLLVGLGSIVLLVVAPQVGGAPDRATLARGIALGASAQALAAWTLSALRGQGRPAWEAVSQVMGAMVLGLGALLCKSGASLGGAWALAGLASLGFACMAWKQQPALRPAWGVGGHVLQGLPYLGLGMGAWALGNLDLVLGRIYLTPSELGLLSASTLVVRSGSLAPWLLGALLLHRVHARRAVGAKVPGWGFVAAGAGLALMVALAGSALLPTVAWGYGIPLGSLWNPGWLSLACAPAMYGLLALIPVAAGGGLRSTLAGLWLGVAALGATGFALVPSLGIRGAILAGAVGQMVALVALLVSHRLASSIARQWPRAQSSQL